MKKQKKTENTEAVVKKDKKPKKQKLHSKSAFKHGAYAVVITAAVLAAAVVLNVLFVVLSQRVNLNLDLSFTKENTLSAENIDYLKSIDTDVKITVCADRDDYLSGYLDYYVAQQLYGAVDPTGEYYEQTIKLLDQYSTYSNHITVEFIDPQTPEFSAIQSNYANSNLQYGDMIVEATHVIDGEETTRSSVVTFEDIYYLEDTSGYAQYGYDYYYVSGNYFESAMTSAIYKVTSTETKKVAVMNTHCDEDSVEYFTGILQLNNFEVSDYTDTVINSLDSDLDLLIISAPTEDFLPEELEVIEDWLYNNGNRGRGLLYFASTYSPELPNLYEYLTEWGVSFEQGVLFETDASNYLGDPMTIGFYPSDSDDEKAQLAQGNVQLMISGANLPMYQAFDTLDTRYSEVLVTTADESVVHAPLGTATDWNPGSEYAKNEYPAAIMTCDMDYVDNVACSSYVIAFSSTDFISSEWVVYSSVGNIDLALNSAKVASGAEDDNITFTMKTVTNESFAAQVSTQSANVIRLIFQYGLPVILIAAGIVVFVRRSRR